MAELSSSDAQAILRIEPGIPGEDTLTVRITPAYATEFVYLLDSHHLSHSEVFEASYTDGLSIYLVYGVGALVALGGFGGLAKVLVALFHRRDANASQRWLTAMSHGSWQCSQIVLIERGQPNRADGRAGQYPGSVIIMRTDSSSQ
jgi:hypothetical protein